MRRHFLLALTFAQDEDLAANIRYRMRRVHLHRGGPAEAGGRRVTTPRTLITRSPAAPSRP
ncbi:hypothetical protein AB0M48_10880 [Lentzea sp. NPDC051208]|uniref:hypothetical protein n=1 Tax=Lentzea sp. NPDC051208 TaxID=3154642 RepID=UPI003424BFEB